MNNQSTNNMTTSKFVITAQPVCFVRSVTPLTSQIDISRIRTNEFCEPVYVAISDDMVRLSDDYIAELQAQGVDKLSDSIQDIHDGLMDNGYDDDIIMLLRSEISRCRSFAERLRKPSVQTCDCDNCACTTSTRVLSDSVMVGHRNLCDSCSDKLRGGCLPTCSAYGKENGHA